MITKAILILILVALSSGAFAQGERAAGGAAEGDGGAPTKPAGTSIKMIAKITGAVVVAAVVAIAGSSSTTNH